MELYPFSIQPIKGNNCGLIPTLLQELKGRLYFKDSSDSYCVNSVILLNFVYLFYFLLNI